MFVLVNHHLGVDDAPIEDVVIFIFIFIFTAAAATTKDAAARLFTRSVPGNTATKDVVEHLAIVALRIDDEHEDSLG